MSKVKPWLLLAVIFVVGCVTGSALTMSFSPHFMHPHPPGAQQMKKLWLMHLTSRLNLTADQQAKIEPILADAGSQLQSVHRDEVERASQIIEATNKQLATVLTPEQQAEMTKMEKEMDRDRDRMFPGHMRPHGPHGGQGGMPPPPPPPEENAPNHDAPTVH